MQRSGDISELIERLQKSLIGLAKNFAPSFRKQPYRLSKPAAFEASVDFKIVRIEFSETYAKLK